MDPNEALRRIIATLKSHQNADEDDVDVVFGLLEWLKRGGFEPDAALQQQFAQAAGTRGSTLARGLRAVLRQWEYEVDTADDVPWTTLTYGVMPSKSLFKRNFRALVKGDKQYHYALKGDDKAVFRVLGLNPGPTTVDEDDLWYIVQELHAAYEANDDMDNDSAGDILSSILQTLHIEWI